MRLQEKETIINYNEAEATATVYTHNAALRRKLEGLCDQRPGDAKRGRTFPDGGTEYIVPKKWVKIAPPRILTPSQRAALERAAKRARESRTCI